MEWNSFHFKTVADIRDVLLAVPEEIDVESLVRHLESTIGDLKPMLTAFLEMAPRYPAGDARHLGSVDQDRVRLALSLCSK